MSTKDVTRKRLTLRLDAEIYRRVEVEANKRGISVNAYISTVLHDINSKTG